MLQRPRARAWCSVARVVDVDPLILTLLGSGEARVGRAGHRHACGPPRACRNTVGRDDEGRGIEISESGTKARLARSCSQ